MKVAIVAYLSGMLDMLAGIETALLEDGHEVVGFFQEGRKVLGLRREQIAWGFFRLSALEQFCPDTVLLFNGHARETTAAAQFIASRYRTLTYEVGWLPQRGTVYLDEGGHNGRSALARADLGREGGVSVDEVDATYDELVQRYRPAGRPKWLPPRYILLPLQVEDDTAIRLDSPFFKTMASLAAFVECAYSDIPLVVKGHPKAAYAPNSFAGAARFVTTECDMTTLAYYATHIVGANSTSLIEALVHLKPVGALGFNVASGSGVFYPPQKLFRSPRSFLEYEPNEERVKRTLHRLVQRQFHHHEAPDYALDMILRC